MDDPRGSAVPPLAAGTLLDRYELVRRVAVGGMAELYVAEVAGIEGFRKRVALKRILPHLAHDDDFVAMFLHEARLAATLSHPNVAQVYDIGKSAGSHFFTMEYVDGIDVRALMLASGRIPLEHAMVIAAGTAAGLHHAHEQKSRSGAPLGIVHRDVSPSNLVVSYDGAVKLVDFGIAKATNHSPETRTGATKGKIAYMSPEQCRGEPLDRRSDVFSLGVTLFEMSTGRRLFAG